MPRIGGFKSGPISPEITTRKLDDTKLPTEAKMTPKEIPIPDKTYQKGGERFAHDRFGHAKMQEKYLQTKFGEKLQHGKLVHRPETSRARAKSDWKYEKMGDDKWLRTGTKTYKALDKGAFKFGSKGPGAAPRFDEKTMHGKLVQHPVTAQSSKGHAGTKAYKAFDKAFFKSGSKDAGAAAKFQSKDRAGSYTKSFKAVGHAKFISKDIGPADAKLKSKLSREIYGKFKGKDFGDPLMKFKGYERDYAKYKLNLKPGLGKAFDKTGTVASKKYDKF
jgi:hypothetical protein